MGMAENTSIPVNVGVVLDLDSDLDGRIALSCIEMALSDFYATHGDYKTRLVLNTRDSMEDVVGAAAAANNQGSFQQIVWCAIVSKLQVSAKLS
ncbi:hypothetical protein NC651_037836 [Populus alba x Populus x berolinensis]|nr:hypothetical protein NC651_037836 [Populus alba x Populus x berolinensis]